LGVSDTGLIECDIVEFAVEDISDIQWDPEPFQRLVIPDERKELILALATSHMNQAHDPSFDDFVAGKGRGLIMLLQYEIRPLLVSFFGN
jgi:hypothetical protein